jgi:small ligand-binding sensory domain FIST
LQAELSKPEIIGGAAVGSITNEQLTYTGYECAVAAFSASIPKPTIIVADNLDQGEVEAGQHLGAQLKDLAYEGDTVLLFYDSIRSGPPPELYVGNRIMDGIYQGLSGKSLKLVGAGTVGDLQLTGSYVYARDRALKHAVVAIALPSMWQSQTTIMHGCLPVSSFLEITRIDGPVVYEFDGRPALQVLQEMISPEPDPSFPDNLSLMITLGEKHGNLFAPYDEANYVNRLIISANPADSSVTLFEADFQVGTKVQIMARDNQLMLESVRQRTQELLTSMGSQKPIFALYIDCAGRTSAFSGAEIEEAAILQVELGPDIPLFGFYSGVEIAPLLGRSRPLDWTGVLTLFTLKEPTDE